jgi:hypothetical protein
VERFLATELPRAILRIAAALVIYGLVTAVPWPGDVARWLAPGAFAALATACLLTCGTLLYNTLFFERHWRQADTR